MTPDNLFLAIDQFLASASYYPCLLLVHSEISQLQAASQQISDRYDYPHLSVGRLLSQALLSPISKNRASYTQRAWVDMVKAHRPGPALCTDIDLFFEPSLALDGLRLLREASRQVRLIVMWPGTFNDGVLAYATADHAHYQTWPQTDLCNHCIVTL